ncbi:MAG: hypothetical protein H8D46_01540 [FCB group bacterium]|nr:hypothetical protein [FCB group bacterium]
MNNQNTTNRKMIAGLFFLLAAITLIPMSNAREISYLGYRAVCSFSPISTLILAGFGALLMYYTRKNSQSGN